MQWILVHAGSAGTTKQAGKLSFLSPYGTHWGIIALLVFSYHQHWLDIRTICCEFSLYSFIFAGQVWVVCTTSWTIMSMSRGEQLNTSQPCTRPWMEWRTSPIIHQHTYWRCSARTNWAGETRRGKQKNVGFKNNDVHNSNFNKNCNIFNL